MTTASSLLAAATLLANTGVGPSPPSTDPVRIVIDPGHDQVEPGAKGARGSSEVVLNDRLAEWLASYLAAHPDLEVFRSRTPAEIMGLKERARQIADLAPDLVISLHHDSVKPRFLDLWVHGNRVRPFCDQFRGYSVFAQVSGPEHARSQRLARRVAGALRTLGIPRSRYHAMDIPGERRRWIDAALGIYHGEWLYLLRTLEIPTILVETGFIIHREEEQRLTDPTYVERLAQALAAAILAEAHGWPER